MRKNRSSLTATGIAIVRALESEKPVSERVCYDPYARRFIPAWLYRLLGFFIKTGYAEWRGPGVNGFLVTRDRYMDDVLQNALDEGLQQLVILGAGYDSRAYRFNLGGQVKTFEVDHPATQADKLAKVQAIFGKTPGHVRYIPIDFNIQTLEERLLASDYDPALKTLFIWQGVSMYLTGQAVDATLAFVVHHSGPGSAIVFDYVYQAALDGVQKHGEIGNMRRYRALTGEGLTFGIAEGAAEEFLMKRGFHRVQDVNGDYLKATYFTGKNAARKVAGWYGIATGIV